MLIDDAAELVGECDAAGERDDIGPVEERRQGVANEAVPEMGGKRDKPPLERGRADGGVVELDPSGTRLGKMSTLSGA